MNVTGIQEPQAAAAATYDRTRTRQTQAPAAESKTDTTTFSTEAKRLAQEMLQAQAEQAEVNEATTATETDEEYPLEAYRIPGWFHPLTGGYMDVGTQIGANAEESTPEYLKLSKADQRLYGEYSEKLYGYYRDELDKAGISSDIGDYYHNFLQNPETQATVREGLYERLKSDDRAQELMRYFGIEM